MMKVKSHLDSQPDYHRFFRNRESGLASRPSVMEVESDVLGEFGIPILPASGFVLGPAACRPKDSCSSRLLPSKCGAASGGGGTAATPVNPGILLVPK